MAATPPADWREKFLKFLEKIPNVSRACRAARVSRSTAYATREADKEFAQAWDDALGVGVELAEAEAWRRATQGCLEPIYQGGAKVGAKRVYSDTLLMFMLKAHKPEVYSEQRRLEHSGPGGGPIVLSQPMSDLSDEERRERARELLAAALTADADDDDEDPG